MRKWIAARVFVEPNFKDVLGRKEYQPYFVANK
jgi:hypothetical protein